MNGNSPTTQQIPSTAATSAPGAMTRAAPSPLDALLQDRELYRLRLEPVSQDEAWEVAEAAAKAGLAASTEEAYARILIGRPLGIPAMASIQGIALVENNKTGLKTACMYAKLKLALLQSRRDVIEYIRPKTLSNTEAVWVGKRVGAGEEPIEYRFTIEDARIAGLVGRGDGKTNSAGASLNNYDRHPGPMLQWRACGRLCDILGADILNSLATREDLEDEERMAREERLSAAARGEVPAPLPPPQAAPARNFDAECDQLKADIASAVENKDKAKLADVRARFKRFSAEAPAELADELKRYYNVVVGEAKKAHGAQQPAGAAAQAPATPPAQSAPAAPAAPAQAAANGNGARGEYLPPDKRGDSYEGPEDPLT